MAGYSIIGHDGIPMDNDLVQGELVLHRIGGWTPQAIIGAYETLVGQFPGLMRAAVMNPSAPASRVLLNPQIMRSSAPPALQQFHIMPMASQLVPAGQPGPTVVESHPGPVGLSLVPMNQPVAILAGATSTITVLPQSIFKPYRLTVDPVIAAFFLINSLQVGVTPLFDAPGAVPCSSFPPNLQQGNLKKITATPGLSITMQVQNRDGVAHPFFSTMFGEAAPTQCG